MELLGIVLRHHECLAAIPDQQRLAGSQGRAISHQHRPFPWFEGVLFAPTWQTYTCLLVRQTFALFQGRYFHLPSFFQAELNS